MTLGGDVGYQPLTNGRHKYAAHVTESLPNDQKRFGATFLWWAFLAGIAIAGFVAFLSWQVHRGFDETGALRAEVLRSYENRAELERILSLHRDLETGQRGYVLTADPEFLEPYEDASRQMQASIGRLRAQWRGNAERIQNLTELDRLSRLKRKFAEETIAFTRQGNVALAQERIAGGIGRRLMDDIRRLVAAIDDQERQQLTRRTAVAERARANLQTRTVALQIMLVLLLVLAFALLVRAYRGWQRTLQRERDLAARQEAIFEAARDGMLMINASGGIESLNPAAAAMFGYEPDEMIRRDVGILFDVAPDQGRVETFLRRLAGRQQRGAGDVQDFIGRCKDGSVFPAAVTVSPVEFGGQTRFLAVLRDITERSEVSRMKTEFVSTVSHELRTPLTSIAGSLGLIAGGAAGQLPERAQRLVEIAQSNCARLIRLINDILDIEKIESGKMHFDIKPLSLSALLTHAIDANQEFAASHGVTIELGALPQGAGILGDEDRVMQVLTNLLSNAAKFSPRGGVVRVDVIPLTRRYRVSVADQGPGIPEEFRERIFSKFAQADSSDTRVKGGTGLGLSIVREIVDRLGGAVSFDSVPGAGTTFHVDLPAAADVDAGKTVEPLGRISDAELPLVLHVDDDPDMLRIVTGAFEGRAQVHSSPSVVEARASIQRYRFDAVILDIAMPDGDGLELIPVIRERQQAAIVVFTAQDAEPERVKEADLVLVKSRDSLDRLVAEVVRMTTRPAEGTS
jgi:PAS domain S-box-containing protein